MEKLRVIQVGTAPMVHSAHAAIALKGLPDTYILEGIVEEDDALRASAEKNKAYEGLTFMSWEEALSRKPDAFIIETDEHKLVENAIRALEAGYHVYMDKPGSEDSAQFHRMCRLAKEKKLVLSLGYMFRHNPAVVQALQLKREGALGEIFSVEGQMSVATGVDYRNTLKRFKGGMMYYLGCHMIDLVVAFCGFPDEVIPMNSCSGLDGVDCVDIGFCAFKYKNGVSFVKTTAVELNGANRRSLIVSGSKGTFEIRPMEEARGDGWDDTFARVTLDNRNPWHDGSVVQNYPPHRRYDGLFLDFAKFVRGEAENPYTYDYEARLHDLILAACGIG